MPNILRRRLIKTTGIAAIFAMFFGVPGYWWLRNRIQLLARRNDPVSFVASVIRLYVPELPIAEEDLAEFCQDYAARNWEKISSRKVRRAIETKDPESDRSYRYAAEDIITRFMLSTDYLSANRESRDIVHYLGYADPYERGCANNFAVLGL